MNNSILTHASNCFNCLWHSGRVSDEMALVGAIAGDVTGSAYELKGTRIKTTSFELFTNSSTFTDDTVMTLAVAKWLCGFNLNNSYCIKTVPRFYKNEAVG